MNDAQQQLAEQSARNLAGEAAATHPTPTDVEVADGRFAYAAYGSESGAGDKTWDGRPMPTWDQMGDRQRAGWIAVGRAFAATSGQIDGVRPVRVRVIFDENAYATVKPVDGKDFTGYERADADTAFMAVCYPGGRTAVLRFEQPLTVQQSETTVDALLIDGR